MNPEIDKYTSEYYNSTKRKLTEIIEDDLQPYKSLMLCWSIRKTEKALRYVNDPIFVGGIKERGRWFAWSYLFSNPIIDLYIPTGLTQINDKVSSGESVKITVYDEEYIDLAKKLGKDINKVKSIKKTIEVVTPKETIETILPQKSNVEH